MNASNELRDLVESAHCGETEAWRCLEDRCRNRLAAHIRSLMGERLRHEVDIDDLLQETFFRAFLALEGFQWIGDAAFWAWLERIASHVVQAEARYRSATKRRVPQGGLRPDQVSAGAVADAGWEGITDPKGRSPSEYSRGSERRERLWSALRDLPPEDAQIVVLVSLRGMSVEGAAGILGCSAGAARMRLLRALRKLRVSYGPIGSSDSLTIPPGSGVDPDGR